MSEQLREALRALADTAPLTDASAEASTATWRQARRARQRAMAAGVLGVVALAGTLVASANLSSRPESVPAVAPPYDAAKLAIPDQVWLPSSWTPGTAEAGPLGPLALIASAPRHTSWVHTEDNALFGISAATGRYRFLDLPHVAADASVEPVLSPDGLHIAYFATGRPAGPSPQSTVTGYAVYDTVTAMVHVKAIPTVHGLMAESITWSGDSSSVVACFDQYTARAGTGHVAPGEIWSPSGAAPKLPPSGFCPSDFPGPAPGGIAASDSARGGGFQVLDTATATLRPSPLGGARLVRASPVGPPMLSPSGTLVAVEGQPDTGIGPRIYVGRIASGRTSATEVPTRGVIDAYGWTDERHLLTRIGPGWTICEDGDFRASRPPGPGAIPQVYRIKISTGERCIAVELHGSEHEWLNPEFAASLLQRPIVTRPAPQSYRDPRMLPAVAAFLIVIGAVVLLVRRRSRLSQRPQELGFTPSGGNA